MKKFLLCLLAIGVIAGTFAIGNNWNTIKGWFTPAQEEVLDDENTIEDESDANLNEDNENGSETDILDTPVLRFTIGG